MALPGVGVASCGRHGAAPPLPSGRGRWWRHLSRLREGSQVSVGSSARVKRTKKVIRPAETFKFRPVRAAGEGWLLKRKGGGPEGGPKMQPGEGPQRGMGRGRNLRVPLAGGDPCGLRGGVPLVFKPQLSHWTPSCCVPV